MKTNTLFTILLVIIILVACTPAATPASIDTVVPTATLPLIPISTLIPPTEYPQILLQKDVILYSGPGNADFDPIRTLKAGDAVYLLGIYADFVQVEATIDGNDVIGFVHKNDLANLPANLSELKPESLPLKPIFISSCSSGIYDFENRTLTYENSGDGYSDTESASINIDAPLHIRIDGMQVKKGAPDGSIKILGIPDTGDPWWKGILRMDIAYNNGKYQIYVRDGSSESVNYFLDNLNMETSQTIQIIFEQTEGKSFVILDGNNKQIERVDLTQQPGLNLTNGLFPERKVYFGTSSSPHSTLVLKDLQVGTIADGRWSEQANWYPGLAELAGKRNLTVGTEFSTDNANDVKYCQTMKRHFNLAAISLFSWKGIWLGPGQYDFSSLDRQVDYANQQGWRVRASHLVWGAMEGDVIPDWLLNGKFTRDEYIQILEQHVKTLVGRYKGRVQEWNVANEAPSRSFYQGSDFWNDKIGPEYIEISFRWAREIDPDGILIFNENNNEDPRDPDSQRVFTKMYDTVKELKAKGVSIDGVGMQMHLLMKYSSSIVPKKEDVLATMRKFSDLGVKIYITEFDVDLHDWPGTPEERLQFEADLYKDMMQVCLESNVCESFTTWGISDSTSWLMCQEKWCLNEPDADPLMFDQNYDPKPAYFAIRDVLLNYSSPGTP